MHKNNLPIVTLVIASLFFVATGCVKLVKEEETQKSAAAKEEAAAVQGEKVVEQPIQEAPLSEAAVVEKEVSARAEAGDEITELARKKGMLLTVYFDFDRFTIRDDMKSILEKDALWLKENPGVNIQIQGYCDERGSDEYNIALGERRAQSIRGYLINYGISQSRLSTISYGEERPVDSGHTEEAWVKNRRGELVIIKK